MATNKKEIVEKINASFTNNNIEGFLEHCAENVVWTMVGEKTTNGKRAIREWMKSMEGTDPPNFTVTNLVADGEVAVANGDMTMKDQDGKLGKYSYCDIYRFNGDKVIELTSYLIKTDTQSSIASA